MTSARGREPSGKRDVNAPDAHGDALAPDRPARPADLPGVDRLLRLPDAAALVAEYGHALVADGARDMLGRLRDRARAGALQSAGVSDAALLAGLADAVRSRLEPAIRPVLNLTGIVVHSNLGRAPLPEAAMRQLASVGARPCTLEYDLDEGRRGERDEAVEALLCRLTGAEAAIVVNNNAAAVLLVVAALAGGRETIVSRGELVEIGGSFRIPDIVGASGSRLVEVGTTNRTHPHDYESAIGAHSALLLKVHPSNYRIEGFVASVPETTLAAIARRHGLPLACDLGSGALVDLSRWHLPREPLPGDMLAAGCDLVTISGDKLLGGPQAGIVVGVKALVDRLRTHPLKRALRVGKLSLAALEATLRCYQQPDLLVQQLPVLRLLTRPAEEIRALADTLRPELATALGSGWIVSTVALDGHIGSGALPVARLPSWGLAIAPAQAASGRQVEILAAELRRLPEPVLGRIVGHRLLLDLRCLEDPDALRRLLPAIGAIDLPGRASGTTGAIDLAP